MTATTPTLPHRGCGRSSKLAHAYASPPVSPTARFERSRLMEDDGRRPRQDDAPVFPPGRADDRRSGGGPPPQGATQRFHAPSAMAPTSASRDPLAPGYGYGYVEGQQPFQYPEEYGSDAQRQQAFGQYGPNMMYNLPHQSPQPLPYDPVQPYPPRQSTAIEVLATQFTGVPQYFGANEPTGASGPAVPSQFTHPPFSSLSYSQSGTLGRPGTGTGLGAAYTSGMPDYPPAQTQETLAAPPMGEETAYDDAYQQYQTALKQTFENTHAGKLAEAGESLLEITEWLLSHAVNLGLVRDEQALQTDRIRLWNEFNTCWLATLQVQSDMTHEILRTGRMPIPPQSILTEDFLERMGHQLVRLCDDMERHGLVDYQMGVWEEEIINILTECITLLMDNNLESLTQAPSSTSSLRRPRPPSSGR